MHEFAIFESSSPTTIFFCLFILQHNLLISRKNENKNSLQSLLKSSFTQFDYTEDSNSSLRKINAWRRNEGQRYSYRQ